MAQNTVIERPVQRYSRVDFTALRARLNKIPTETIARLYYSEDALEELGCTTPALLERRLEELRDQLIQRASVTSPGLAAHLADARRFNAWPKTVVDHLVQAGEADRSVPQIGDAISVWFKPQVASALAADGVRTLSDLKTIIELRGTGWWRPVQRIGEGKARAIERWWNRTPSLGPLVVPVDEPVEGQLQLSTASAPTPLERIRALAQDLDGSQGRNRSPQFCLVAARNDLDAVKAYLYKFRGQDKTHRAYQKELERFLLWCVLERQVALASVLTEECEAYKDFLAAVPAAWCGPKAPRHSDRWRPFMGPLLPQSQRYAVQVVKGCFEWLTKVRYLGGNPWVTVSDPRVAQREVPMDIDKALPERLWRRVAEPGGLLDQVCDRAAASSEPGQAQRGPHAPGMRQAQFRLARAVLLLLGSTGLRREEAANAVRGKLRPVPERAGDLWELSVLGKRNKWRTVYLPLRVVTALKAHWADRGHDFEAGEVVAELALLSPVIVAPTPTGRVKHQAGTELSGAGFSPNGLYQVVKTAMHRLAEDASLALDEADRQLLQRVAPHALRHTFATHAAAKDMPTDVLQRILGHASSQTTAIYVRAERARSIDEAAKLFGS